MYVYIVIDMYHFIRMYVYLSMHIIYHIRLDACMDPFPWVVRSNSPGASPLLRGIHWCRAAKCQDQAGTVRSTVTSGGSSHLPSGYD